MRTHLRILYDANSKVEVERLNRVIVCPVSIEFLWRNSRLAIIEQFDMIQSFYIHGACSFVSQTAALFRGRNVGNIAEPRFRGAFRGDKRKGKEKIAEPHYDCREMLDLMSNGSRRPAEVLGDILYTQVRCRRESASQ